MATKRNKQSLGRDRIGPSSDTSNRWGPYLAGVIIVIAGLAAYANSFAVPEIFDDAASISRNSYIRRLWPITEAMKAPPQETTAGRPILCLSLAVNYAISGLKVWSYHGFNLTVHIFAGLTLFGIVRRTLLSDRLRDRFRRHALLLALVCAVLWVVHPLQTQAVTYIIQRAESMMGMFYLLTLYCAIRSFRSARPLAWQVAATCFSALGMGTKETMVTAPLMVLLYDRIFIGPSFKDAVVKRWRLHALLGATWVVLAGLMWTGPRSRTVGFELAAVGPLDYARAQCGIVLHYLRLVFWPNPLVLDYAWQIPKTLPAVLLPGAGILALLGATLLALRKAPHAAFPGIWFFVILAPTSSFVPINDLAFEHRMYLSLAGVIVSVVLVGYLLTMRYVTKERRAIALLTVAAVLLSGLLGWRTHQRNNDYGSSMRIWSETIAHAPGNHRAHNNLGYAYRRRGDYDQAIRHYNRAIELNDKYAKAYNNRGAAYGFKGDHRKAFEDFSKAIKLDPSFARAYCNRGTSWGVAGQYDLAMIDYDKAISLNGNYAKALICRAQLFAAMGKLELAIRDYDRALQLRPDMIQARQARAQIKARMSGASLGHKQQGSLR